MNDVAEIADKFTRNEIATSNEIRQIIGWRPANDPKADELRNSNLSQPTDEGDVNEIPMGDESGYEEPYDQYEQEEGEIQNEV